MNTKHLLSLLMIVVVIIIITTVVLTTRASKPTEPEPTFVCQYQKDNSAPLSAESMVYFEKARKQQRGAPYLPTEDWQAIEQNYLKAVELGNWKAMNNLALLYVKGAYSKEDLQTDMVLKGLPPTGIKRDRTKAIALYEKMIEMKLPLGYYNWYAAIRDGVIPNAAKGEAGKALFEAARLGNPTAQAIIGNNYAFGRPREKQRDDIAELYFRCAGAQDNAEALVEVAGFYDVAKKNKPRALFYYQKAASLGNETGLMFLKEAFSDNPVPPYNFGYSEDLKLREVYKKIYYQWRENSRLTFPNLVKDYPLPRHPIQGYDADNPDVRPE